MRKKVIACILITAITLGLLTACSWEKPSIFTDIELEVNEAFEEHESQGNEMQ